ncbi:MAG: AmmeMemoRadiSam system protein B [Deltaproteobacteria bacterium]|nr:AmmeMemoRadiSam system protein B [Deltaproteobacteria bacterium]
MGRTGMRSVGLAACALLALGATCRKDSGGGATGTAVDAGAGVEGESGEGDGSAAARARLIGIISPHAGYEYSGAVAGFAWKQLEGAGAGDAGREAASIFPAQQAGGFYPADPAVLRSQVEGFLAAAEKKNFDVGPIATVIVLAPSHHYPFTGGAVLAEDGYQTPLGVVRVDAALRTELVEAAGGDVVVDSRVFEQEHALEVQLPFLQVALPGAAVVPVIVGDTPLGELERLGQAIAGLLRERSDVVVVASSDMSHFHPYDGAVSADEETMAALTTLDLEAYDRVGSGEESECPTGPCMSGMCGYNPVRVALGALLAVAPEGAKVVRLKYANSGDVTGERERVVGYGALALVREEPASGGEEAGMYTREERQSLIDIAKAAVAAAVRGESYEPAAPESEALRRDGAAFVTLKTNGELRGCIGMVEAHEPLYLCVASVARSAAVEDPRFDPVSTGELGALSYEISVLTPPETVTDPTTVVVGRDGLIVSRGGRRGLLLPQVPEEQGWNREQFLDGTCRKAGLPTGCWRDRETRIQRFRAVVWGEELVDLLG